jgi:hypothetical protein
VCLMVIVIVPLGTCERCVVPRRRFLGRFVCGVSGVGVRDGVLNVREIMAFGHGSLGVMC